MPAVLRLTPAQLELVDAYVASLRAIGIHTDPKAVWPARAFGARVGAPHNWAALSLEAQCALPLRIRHFVSWLIVTQRVATSAAYVIVGRPFLGDVALRHHPTFGHAFLDTAVALGFAQLPQWPSGPTWPSSLAWPRSAPSSSRAPNSIPGCAALLTAAETYRPQ